LLGCWNKNKTSVSLICFPGTDSSWYYGGRERGEKHQNCGGNCWGRWMPQPSIHEHMMLNHEVKNGSLKILVYQGRIRRRRLADDALHKTKPSAALLPHDTSLGFATQKRESISHFEQQDHRALGIRSNGKWSFCLETRDCFRSSREFLYFLKKTAEKG
jgi:hypothetical protein